MIPKEIESFEDTFTTLLHVQGLKVSFDQSLALDDLHFKLRKGETIAIVGESGSGKSVTALSILRLLSSSQNIDIQGQLHFLSPKYGLIDLLSLTEKQMQHIRGNEISMIFQEPMSSLNPIKTCGSQVTEAIRIHRNTSAQEARDECILLFNKVKLPRAAEIYRSYPHQLSGGQKQRVMIAMAMACNPSILIADEPTTALDASVQATILDLIKELRNEQNMSTLFITHDLGLVSEIADRVLVMYKGKVVEYGSVFNIFTKPKHPYTKGLLSCRPNPNVVLRKLPTIADFMHTQPDGELVEKKAGYLDVSDAIEKNIVTNEMQQARQFLLHSESHIFDVYDLCVTYHPAQSSLFSASSQVKALDQVSFHVYEGETLGVVGESGSGKSTLGRALSHLLSPQSGHIRYFSKDIYSLPKQEVRALRKDIQIIFQDPFASLNPRLTIEETLSEPIRLHHGKFSRHTIRKTLSFLLDKVNLPESALHRYPHQFSGGQRQRISIARALAVNPKVIICDEIVSALDISVQAQILNLLNDLKRELKLTYVFISHDLSVVKFMSDRILVMNKGKIEEIGSSSDVFAHPTSEYTQKLIQSIPKGEIENVKLHKLKAKLGIT